jgi:mevalonate kinase
MLTGEYAVLKGATALALPTQKGQRMSVVPCEGGLRWTNNDPKKTWFTGSWDSNGKRLSSSDEKVSEGIEKILRAAQKLNPRFQPYAHTVICTLEFPTNWGLGSSSTFIALIAQWANTDAMQLFRAAWQGSGYDVAVAVANNAIAYRLNNKKPMWNTVQIAPPDPADWFFIHTNTKQSTYAEITRFGREPLPHNTLDRIDEINRKILGAMTNDVFAIALTEHEKCISALIDLPTIREKLFPDYPFTVKSLGAWGGDFFLAHIPHSDYKDYFLQKNYKNLFNWIDFIKT